MGLKNSSLLPTPNDQSYLKHPKGLSLRGAMKTDLLEADLAGKTWVLKKESLFMHLPVSVGKSWVG